jgi:hypothetical protein
MHKARPESTEAEMKRRQFLESTALGAARNNARHPSPSRTRNSLFVFA